LGSSGRLGLQGQAYGAFFEPVVLLQVEMSTVRCVVLGEREEVADQGLQPGSACRRQSATTAGAPTDQARVCLAVPPATLASPFAVIWRASPVAVRAQRVARTSWVVVLDVDDQGPGVLPWMSGPWCWSVWARRAKAMLTCPASLRAPRIRSRTVARTVGVLWALTIRVPWPRVYGPAREYHRPTMISGRAGAVNRPSLDRHSALIEDPFEPAIAGSGEGGT
jgi:hypothetical protein